MSQLTIYLDAELAEKARRAAAEEGVSQSKWIAALVRERLRDRWSEATKQLAGAWSDFPSVEELRDRQGVDVDRETL